MAQNRTKFEQAYMLDCSKFIEKKKTDGGRTELSYLSWAYAWAQFQVIYPDATYEVKKNPAGLPFFASELGIMVYTTVTADGVTKEMWLPVMDGSNKAMKAEPYTYKVKDYKTGGFIDKPVKAADMFDVNKTIMRCLAKNLAMFGLGLSIYCGEDIPQPLTNEEEEALVEEVKEKKTRGRKKAAPAPQEPPHAQLSRVTLEMYQAGRCKSIVAFLSENYDSASNSFAPEALQRIEGAYTWNADALDAVKAEAARVGFKNDLNS